MSNGVGGNVAKGSYNKMTFIRGFLIGICYHVWVLAFENLKSIEGLYFEAQ